MSSIALTWCLETSVWVWSGHKKRDLVRRRSHPLSGWYYIITMLFLFWCTVKLTSHSPDISTSIRTAVSTQGNEVRRRIDLLYQVERQWHTLTYAKTNQIHYTVHFDFNIDLQPVSVSTHDALLWNHFGSVFKACWVVSWQQSGHVPWFQLQNTENQLFNFISFWKGPYWLAGDQLCSTMKDVKDDMSRLVTRAWSGNHDSI